MGYELSFYKIDLNRIKNIEATFSDEISANEQFSEIVNSYCSYIDEIEHGTGHGKLFEKYIRTIAGDYFSEPRLYELFMDRRDIFPHTSGIEWGYLRLQELKQFISSAANKTKQSYFEDNDDFEEDLDILVDVFQDALKDGTDILCVYS